MKRLVKKEYIFFIVLLFISHTYANIPATISVKAKKTSSKKKKSSGFWWKFSTGFVTGITTMHVLQKTLIYGIFIPGKFCPYKKIKNNLKARIKSNK